jgi:tetratricopeptide (TPR) repeat protein
VSRIAKVIAAALAAVLLCAAGVARADEISEARQHYQRAQTHYAVAEFADAAREYQEAYKLKPDPALLYNAAQASRLAGLHRQALLLYKNYVNFYPRERNVADARAHVARLEPLVAQEEQAKNAPPTATTEPRMGGGGTSAAPTEPREAVAAAPVRPAAGGERRPVYKAWWLWTIVGVVVVGGVTAAVVATQVEKTPWATGGPIGRGAALGQAVLSW